jgi:type II secretory pathway component GspD/PulD (secretin)
VALMLAGSASPSWGDTPAATVSPLVTVKLQSASLIDALRSLTQDAEIVIANEEGLKDKTVSISLKDKPIEEALNKLLSPNNIPWYRAEDGTYIINAARPASAAPSTPSSVLAPAPDLPLSRQFMVTEKIELRHISPDEALAALGIPSYGFDRRTMLTTKPTYELGNYADPTTFSGSAMDLGGNTGLRPANPNALNTGYPNDTVLPQNDGSATGDGFNRAPEDRDQFGQGRRPGFQPGQNVPRPPGAPGTTGPGATGTNGTTTANGQNGSARGFLPPGIELVAGLATDNSLMVLGPPDDIDELRSTIRLLDIAPQQVSIKVDVITVSTSAVRQFGSQFQFFTRQANITSSAGTVPNGITFDVIRGNLQAIIGALTTNGRGRLISSPILTTQNNTLATITQGTTTPVFVPQVVQSQGGIVTTTQVIPVSANTGLVVIPRINRDGTITVQGSVNVASILRIVSSPDGSSIAPEINQTQLQGFNRRVASGETLVIGGLNSKNETDDENRVPILGDIPIIGKLFRGRNRTVTDAQLLIFLTPQIVGDRASTGEAPP